jgi:hypothetical protein
LEILRQGISLNFFPRFLLAIGEIINLKTIISIGHWRLYLMTGSLIKKMQTFVTFKYDLLQ